MSPLIQRQKARQIEALRSAHKPSAQASMDISAILVAIMRENSTPARQASFIDSLIQVQPMTGPAAHVFYAGGVERQARRLRLTVVHCAPTSPNTLKLTLA